MCELDIVFLSFFSYFFAVHPSRRSVLVEPFANYFCIVFGLQLQKRDRSCRFYVQVFGINFLPFTWLPHFSHIAVIFISTIEYELWPFDVASASWDLTRKANPMWVMPKSRGQTSVSHVSVFPAAMSPAHLCHDVLYFNFADFAWLTIVYLSVMCPLWSSQVAGTL